MELLDHMIVLFLDFLGPLQTVVHSGCICLHFYPQCIEVYFLSCYSCRFHHRLSRLQKKRLGLSRDMPGVYPVLSCCYHPHPMRYSIIAQPARTGPCFPQVCSLPLPNTITLNSGRG